jgi:hypothetical protein
LRLSLPRTQYNDSTEVAGFFNAALERTSATPGVKHAAVAFQPPLISGAITRSLRFVIGRDSVWRFDCGRLCEEANLLYQGETPNFSDG